jgi:Protein of unknown function (DUF3455)
MKPRRPSSQPVAATVTLIAALLSGCASTVAPIGAPAPGAPPPGGAGTIGSPGTVGPAGSPPAGPGPTPLAPLPGTAPTPEPPSLGILSAIRVPDGHDPVAKLVGHGAQVFRCEARESGGFAWSFRQPDAELDDAKGQPIGRHGPNFSFENTDGSRLLGRVVAHDAAPSDSSLPWLLIQTESFGDGQFKGVDFVQRINTVGGMPPPKCLPSQDQQVLRVDFSADFVFYRPH